MSLAAACSWALLRATVLVAIAYPICRCLTHLFDSPRTWVRGTLWVFLLVPVLIPDLLVGYAFSNFGLSLVGSPVLGELATDLILLTRVAAVGTIVLKLAPYSAVSAEAAHCARLARAAGPAANSVPSAMVMWFWGALLRSLPAMVLMWIVLFQQFIVVSMMGQPAWTVWLFDAQRGGLPVADSLRSSALPLAMQCVVLAAAVALMVRSRAWTRGSQEPITQPHPALQCMAWTFVIFALVVNVVIPFWLVLQGTVAGGTIAVRNLHFLREVLVGLSVSALCACAAFIVASWLLLRIGRLQASHGRNWLPFVIVVPGLAGATVLSVTILAICQWAPLRFAYDTPIPLLLGGTALLLPFALLLRLLLVASPYDTGLHVARTMARTGQGFQRWRGRELLWRGGGRTILWAVALLTLWLFFEVTVFALLAPTGMTSATVRLYNEMHYGQSAVLSAMFLCAIVLPVLTIGVFYLLRRLLALRGIA